MRKVTWIRMMVVSAAGLAVAAGAVGAVASSRDSGPDTTRDLARQEATATPAAEQPWLGIAAHPFKDGAGVVIRHVAPDSPADSAGLEPGDVIRAIDGTDVQDVEDLRDAVDDKSVGDEVTLSVVKNGVEDSEADAEDVKVTLGARPTEADLEAKAGEAFERFLGGSFKYVDDDGNEVEVQFVPGTVKSASDTEITIDVNGDEGDRTFSVPEAAHAPDNLSEGDRVTVVLKDGEVQGVHPGVFGMMGGPGFGPEGMPMPFPGGRFDEMPFGDGPMPPFGDGPSRGGPFREFGPHHGPFCDCDPNLNPDNQSEGTSGPDA